MSDASRTFNSVLRAVVVPRLQERGFKFDGNRNFRRFLPDGSIEIINFQLGDRFMSGRFTVNLGIFRPRDATLDPAFELRTVKEYHCPDGRRARLGTLIPRALASWDNLPELGFLFRPRDRWWRFSTNEERTNRSLQTAMRTLDAHAFPWFEQRRAPEQPT